MSLPLAGSVKEILVCYLMSCTQKTSFAPSFTLSVMNRFTSTACNLQWGWAHRISTNVCTFPCKPQHTSAHCAALLPSHPSARTLLCRAAVPLSVCCMLVSHRALCHPQSPVIVPACNLGCVTVRTLGYLVSSVSRDLEQSIWCLPSQLHWIYTHSPSHTEAWSLSKSKQKLWYSIYTSSQ